MVRPAEDGGSGYGLLVEPFPLHDREGSTITTQGRALKDEAGDVENVNADLTASHNHALEGVAGDLTTILTGQDEPAKQQGLRLIQKLVSSGSALELFGNQVDTYNQLVRGFHGQIRQHRKREDQQDSRDRLSGQVSAAGSTLTQQAGQATHALRDPLAPETVARLTRLGMMPTTVTNLYPTANLTDQDQIDAIDAKIANGELPDLAAMSPEEVDTYLEAHPEVAAMVPGLLAIPGPSPAITALVNGAARRDARLAQTGIDGEPGQQALDDIDQGQATLEAINERIANGEKLSASEAAYIESWTNELGADGIAALPQAVDDSVAETMAGAPSYAIEAAAEAHKQPLADAILNYSNPDVHSAEAGIDSAGYQGGSTFTPADGRIVLSEMPEAIQELTRMRLGVEGEDGGTRLGIDPTETTVNGPRGSTSTRETIGAEQFGTIANYDEYAGFADLMSSASDGVEGGADFSADLGHQAIQARQDLNAIDETASGIVVDREGTPTRYDPGTPVYGELDASFDDGPMSEMLSVTGRSEDGSSQLLLNDQDRQSLLAIDWDAPQGATDVITAGTDRDPAGGGDTTRQAEAAAAILTDVGSDPEAWGDRMNEAMEDATLDTGLRWVDTFGVGGDDANDVDPTGQDVLGRDVGPVIQLTDEAKENFMLFAGGTGDEQSVRFQAGLTHYGDQLITAALDSGQPGDTQSDQLKSAMAWSGLANGRMEAANIQSIMNDMGEENDEEVAQAIADNREIAANKTAATFVSSIAGSAAGAIPGAGPFISAGIGALSGPIIDDVFEENPVPDYDSLEDNERNQLIADAAEDSRYSRDYRFASLVAGQYGDDAQYAELYDGAGNLRPLSELNGVELDTLRNLGDNLYEDFNEAHPDTSPVNRADTYDEPFNDALEQARVNLHEDDPEESAEEREQREETERAEEEERQRHWQYGDNQTTWERWDEQNPVQPHPRSGPPRDRESPYDGTPGVNE